MGRLSGIPATLVLEAQWRRNQMWVVECSKITAWQFCLNIGSVKVTWCWAFLLLLGELMRNISSCEVIRHSWWKSWNYVYRYSCYTIINYTKSNISKFQTLSCTLGCTDWWSYNQYCKIGKYIHEEYIVSIHWRKSYILPSHNVFMLILQSMIL